MSFSPSGAMNAYLASTRTFPYEPEAMIPALEHTYTETAQAVNSREISLYSTQEIITGKSYFDPSDATVFNIPFRRIYYIGAIAQGATLNTAHGITGNFTVTMLYGTCITNVVDQRPIPYASATVVTAQISLTVAGANIVIVNGATAPNITSGIVTLEYLYT